MELLGLLAGLAMLAVILRRPPPRRLVPTEAEARALPARTTELPARVDHVRDLEAEVRNDASDGRRVVRAVIEDAGTSFAARAALVRIRLERMPAVARADALLPLLDDEPLRQTTLRTLVELASDGDPASSRLLLDALEARDALAERAVPVLWSILISGPWDLECRAIDRIGGVGSRHDAEELRRLFGREPALAGRIHAAVHAIHERHGAHGLAIVGPAEPQGQLALVEPSPPSPRRAPSGARPRAVPRSPARWRPLWPKDE